MSNNRLSAKDVEDFVMQVSVSSERFKPHFTYLDELNAAIDDALERFSDAEESELAQLKSLKTEVEMARDALTDICVRLPTINGT